MAGPSDRQNSDMMTISPPTAAKRPRPQGFPRIAIAYVLTLISVALGGVAFIVGLVGGQNCDLEGFACLGWLIYGAAAGALLAVVLLVVLALKQRLGLPFAGITVALVAIAAATPGIEPARIVLALLAPGIAAWVTGARKRWWLAIVVLVVALLLVPIGILASQLRTVNYRESLYVREGVAPIGLQDDRGWDYTLVMESVTARGFSYRMEDKAGRQLEVEIVHADDTALVPPTNCSRDPGRSVPCEPRADGVFRSTDDHRSNRIVVRGESVARIVLTSEMTLDDAAFDRLAMSMETQSPRWLADRQCAVCRLLPH